MVDDQVFREVEQELRRERLQAFWQRYATLLIGGVVAALAVISAILWWQSAQITNQQAAGDQFIKALQLSSQDKTQEANKILEALSKNSPKGYELLSTLYLAGNRVQEGQTAQAETLYKKVSNNPTADKILKDYAKLNLALLRVDGATYDETNKALGSFTKPNASWRSTAIEVMGLAAFKEQNWDVAQKHFNEIIADKSSPSSLKRRAQVMLDVIAARKVAN